MNDNRSVFYTCLHKFCHVKWNFHINMRVRVITEHTEVFVEREINRRRTDMLVFKRINNKFSLIEICADVAVGKNHRGMVPMVYAKSNGRLYSEKLCLFLLFCFTLLRGISRLF